VEEEEGREEGEENWGDGGEVGSPRRAATEGVAAAPVTEPPRSRAGEASSPRWAAPEWIEAAPGGEPPESQAEMEGAPRGAAPGGKAAALGSEPPRNSPGKWVPAGAAGSPAPTPSGGWSGGLDFEPRTRPWGRGWGWRRRRKRRRIGTTGRRKRPPLRGVRIRSPVPQGPEVPPGPPPRRCGVGDGAGRRGGGCGGDWGGGRGGGGGGGGRPGGPPPAPR